jgi:hypothetical protein
VITRREFAVKLATCRACRRQRLAVVLVAAAVVVLVAVGRAA